MVKGRKGREGGSYVGEEKAKKKKISRYFNENRTDLLFCLSVNYMYNTSMYNTCYLVQPIL